MAFANFPQQLGKYKLESVLGRGAMGAVYKAFDTEIERDVAIKIIHAYLLDSEMAEELEKRFRHEVKAAARCQHPNIITVFDYGFNQGSPYMVMEYIKGIDLQIFLKSKKSLSAEQSISLILKVLDALNAAHNMGVVHRDIKPANILLLDNGQIKVTDFGIAHIDTSDLTQIGDVMGTPSYMSPEGRNGQRVNHLSDLYTTALVLLELLLQQKTKIDNVSYDFLLLKLQTQNLDSNLTIELAHILTRALQSEPEQRYSDALSFHKALSACLNFHNESSLIEDLGLTVLQVKTEFQNAVKANEISDMTLLENDGSVLLQSQLSIIEKNLTSYLGPIAKRIMKQHTNDVGSITDLLTALAEYIPSQSEQDKFIHSLETSGITKITQSSKTQIQSDLSSEYIEEITRKLTYYLGPIAKHLVKTALKKATSKEQLKILLIEKNPELSEKSIF